MRKIILFILLLFARRACAQEWSVHAGGTVGASYADIGGDHVIRGAPGLAYAVMLHVERSITDHITAGVGCAFRSDRSTYAVSITPGLPDGGLDFATRLGRRSLQFPLLLDIGASPIKAKGIHFVFGVSAITSLPSALRIDSVQYVPGTPKTMLLVNEQVWLRTESGSTVGIRYQVGVAKELSLGNGSIRLKLAYGQDGDRWLCPTVNDPFNEHVPLQGRVVEFGVDWRL